MNLKDTSGSGKTVLERVQDKYARLRIDEIARAQAHSVTGIPLPLDFWEYELIRAFEMGMTEATRRQTQDN